MGFGPFFSSQLSLEELQTLLPGRAIADRGPRLLVRFGDGDRLVVVPPRLRDAGPLAEAQPPVVGDFLLAEPGEEPVVVRVLERRSRLSRNAAGRGTAEQVLAANVDVAFVVQGLDEGVNPRRLERTLAAVHAGGAEPVVVLTKADALGDPGALEAVVAEARAAAGGADVLVASGLTGDGVPALAARLAPALTGVLVGPSGAGKSTLVNALLGGAVQATREVREHDARGRHTTTGRALFALPGGGFIVDGPGIRELRLWDGAGLERAFEDVAVIAEGCRFVDCRHEGEPGCAVQAAVVSGTLDAARVESHAKLARELAWQDARRDGAAQRAQKQKWRAIHREARRFRKLRGR
ncbi:MAG: ribosome small subunit-dependent GTPase A [Anaeromyxobacteraceae bacterium]